MTEDEAKNKWCPMVRVGYSNQGELFDNRQYNNTTTQCIASACMMWRISSMSDSGERSGFCGLGGKP